MSASHHFFFLKLGGSLITDKSQPYTARLEVIDRLAQEILQARQENPGLLLLLGHGSGSFGHTPAHQYNTRQGVSTPQQWSGFFEVWQAAHALDQIVAERFQKTGLPVLPFSPSQSVFSQGRHIISWDLRPIKKALAAGFIPLTYGDVVFDESLGGTIFSTEELFTYLAAHLNPERILLAGSEAGVWKDFPQRSQLAEELHPSDLPLFENKLGASANKDVTGGMLSKVDLIMTLLSENPTLQALIFSGLQPGNVYHALCGDWPGTRLFFS